MTDDTRGLIDFINSRPQPEPETSLTYGDNLPTMSLAQATAAIVDLQKRLEAIEARQRQEMDNAHG